MTWTPLTITPPTGNADSIDSQSGGSIKKRLVHPWISGVGEGTGHYRYLSFPNAVNALVTTLTTEQAALGIAVSASNLTDFANDLEALNQVFPVNELSALARKARGLITLESNKFDLPKAAGTIATQAMSMSGLGAIADLRKSALLQQALSAATEFGLSSPLSNLTNFESKKTAALTAISSALTSSKDNFSGGAGWRFYADSDIANAMTQNMLDHRYTLTAILLFTGTPAELALLREVIV
ncbi:hypothetical protein [Methylobacter sp. S3L5C]|uniref:hypothetical protein n=1 Tax=Methylobacter sp. S3L5C TaxID=2839024 RepID=UPI001FABE1FC|nr:hypothetical protein [Methylobacter sp. S3L5C]UOA08620.1 hypothetical protein KKZ03_20925 [Methylobacter sp. S3L5C]